MSQWNAVDQDTFEKLTDLVNAADNEILVYVFTHRVCKLSTLFEKFPDRADSLDGLVTLIGGINGQIFRKHNCAIYPKEPAHTLEDSSYSLGFMS